MRVIVAEDGMMRELLVAELRRQGLDVIGSARTIKELHRLIEITPPDIVILDIKMPVDEADEAEFSAGIEAAKAIRARNREIALFALSNYSTPFWVDEILSLGPGVGYQLKDRVQSPTELLADIHEVAAGGVRVDQTLVDSWLRNKRPDDRVRELTDKQRDVLELIARGLSNAQIEKKLFLAKTTVQGHERAIYTKLGLSKLPDDEQAQINRRVKAVIAYLSSNNPTITLDDSI
jgi:DNA-binding NarL/FixJ family response regulator